MWRRPEKREIEKNNLQQTTDFHLNGQQLYLARSEDNWKVLAVLILIL